MMNTHHTDLAALVALFELGENDRPADLALVAAALGTTCARADALLARLERRGLVDAERVRLTLPGLALAVAAARTRARRARPGLRVVAA
jgi:Mn-dependent DtxR family transcriptional regulator